MAIFTLFGAWCISCEAAILGGFGHWIPAPALIAGGLVALVAFASGLWATLLLRQLIAGFWMAILVPAAIVAAVYQNGGSEITIGVALAGCTVAGFLLAGVWFCERRRWGGQAEQSAFPVAAPQEAKFGHRSGPADQSWDCF